MISGFTKIVKLFQISGTSLSKSSNQLKPWIQNKTMAINPEIFLFRETLLRVKGTYVIMHISTGWLEKDGNGGSGVLVSKP